MAGKILVLGANGTVGRHVVAGLLAKGEQVVAASRTGQAVPGADSVVFELTDTSTHAAAFAGVDRAFILVPSGFLGVFELVKPLIELAAANKAKVVLQSVFGVDADDSIPYRQIELALEASGTPFVILRPNWFADNFHTFWKPGLAHGVIAVPAGEGKTSFIDARDIGASAVAALTSDAFNGRAFNLTGPEARSYADAAALIAAAIGKPVAYTALSDQAFIDMLVGVGVPAGYASFLASIFYPVREGWTAAVSGGVAELTGTQPRSLETYVTDYQATLAA